MSLKEITHDLHTVAERAPFIKKLLTGRLSKDEYTNYLYQLLMVYSPIEFGCREQGIFDDLPGIDRLPGLYQDYRELSEGKQYTWLPATIEYNKYLVDLINDPDRRHLVKAHFYVRHLGELHGGQLIAKVVPGQGKFYKFEDIDDLKIRVRRHLTNDLGEEARRAFQFTLNIVNELGNE